MSKEGITVIPPMAQELEDNGYLFRRRLWNEQGQLTMIEYSIYARRPHREKPLPGRAATE